MKTTVVLLLVAAAAAACVQAAAAEPLPLIMDDEIVSLAQQVACRDRELPRAVFEVVRDARKADVQVTAGLLRIFFHDCFPQGCDGSIFLQPERRGGPNASLQPRAENIVEEIRRRVHTACRAAVVSCADILAVATRESVVQAGGPSFDITLGRLDSLRAAPDGDFNSLPGPGTSVTRLLELFRDRMKMGTPEDLVALSGGHTVGKASCFFIRNSNEPFIQSIRQQCPRNPDRKQNLDVNTPDAFDNRYFVNLRNRQGVFGSDQGLFDDSRTRPVVERFANDQGAFFRQFAASMTKMSNLKGSGPGEIRRNSCFATNTGRVSASAAEA